MACSLYCGAVSHNLVGTISRVVSNYRNGGYYSCCKAQTWKTTQIQTLSKGPVQLAVYFAPVCLVSGVTDGAEMVKVAVTLLGGRALTWWHAVSTEGWATLGHCDW